MKHNLNLRMTTTSLLNFQAIKMTLKFIETNATAKYLDKIEELTKKLMEVKGLEYNDAKIKTVKYLIENDMDDEMARLRIKYIKKNKINKI